LKPEVCERTAKMHYNKSNAFHPAYFDNTLPGFLHWFFPKKLASTQIFSGRLPDSIQDHFGGSRRVHRKIMKPIQLYDVPLKAEFRWHTDFLIVEIW